MNSEKRVDESEIYQDMKQYSQNNRAENVRLSTEYLQQNDIAFKGNSGRLVINDIIFYPGTGQWFKRGNTLVRFGVRNLVKHIKNNQHGAADAI